MTKKLEMVQKVNIDVLDGHLLGWAVQQMQSVEWQSPGYSVDVQKFESSMLEESKILSKIAPKDQLDSLRAIYKTPELSDRLVLDVLEEDKMIVTHSPKGDDANEEWLAKAQFGLLKEARGVSPAVAILRCALKMRFGDEIPLPKIQVEIAFPEMDEPGEGQRNVRRESSRNQ